MPANTHGVVGFAFVSVDGQGKLEAADRKLVRSHCMAGRNIKADSRRQKAKLAAGRKGKRNRKAETEGDVQGKKATETRMVEIVATTPIPPVPSDLRLVKFACEIDDSSLQIVHKYYSQHKDTIYPSDLYVDFDMSKTRWFVWLTQDPAYVHTALLTCCALNDHLNRVPFGPNTYYHLNRSIQSLNEQLSDRPFAVRDSTLIVVLTLVQMAEVLGDEGALKKHLAGLQQLVRLRGGLQALKHDTKLHLKLSRVDLQYSMVTGSVAPLHHMPITWNPLFSNHARPGESFSYTAPEPTPSVSIDHLVDIRIADCFRDLQCLTAMVNTASPKKRIPSTAFQEIVCSIQYRLMALNGTSEDFLGEAIRLGMLAFLSTTFQLPGNLVRYPYLARRFRECCRAVETTSELLDIIRWLLLVGAISVYGLEEPWLRQRWTQDDLDEAGGWEVARARLCEVMWIGSLHDKAGEKAFDTFCTFRSRNKTIITSGVFF